MTSFACRVFALTITLSHTGTNLAAGTIYTINVPAGSFTDGNNNPVAAFSSTFTTGTSTDTAAGTISMSNPSPGSLGAPLTQTITVTFSKPWNPNLLSGRYLIVCKNQDCNYQVAGSVTTGAQPNTMVFTPSVALPANTRIDVYVGYFATIYDLAGNGFNYLYDAFFSTANTADTTPPQVASITPTGGATNVGPYAPVAISFNKSLDYTTINSYNFALYNGSTNLNAGVSYSSDRSIVYLNTTLPYSSNLTVVVSTNVKDYNGNNMASPYSSTFTTEVQPATTTPAVIQVRPTGSGAALNSPITLFMTSPMNLSTVQAGMYVAQNGALISGTVSLTTDQHGIIWTPTANYLPGALIEVYLYAPAADTSGNVVTGYSYSFHAVAGVGATTPPSETAYNPPKYSYEYLLNPVVEIEFSKPLNPATVTSATAFVKLNNTGSPVSGTPVLVNNGTLLRIPLTSLPLTVNSYYYVTLTNGIQDTSSNPFAGDNYYFIVYPTATTDNTPPTVSAVTPPNGATSVGDNAPVRLVFSKLVDTLTINPATLSLLNGATPLPYTATFTTINSGTQTVAILTPQSPLPDSSTITVSLAGGASGITDLSGNSITGQTTTFTTMTGADFSSAVVIQQSVDSHNNSGVPVNATFTVVFNKPLDPTTVTTNGFFVYDATTGTYPAVHVNVSTDGRTVTISPNANLPNSNSMDYYWYYATDLSGNAATNSSQGFTTSSTADTTPPTVVSSNPFNNNTNIPTNASIEVIFNKAVRATSLGSITLNGGSVPMTAVLNNTVYTDDTVVRLIPQQLLQPGVLYMVSVSGVQDVAGNTMTGTYSFQFTAGNNFQTQGLLLPAVQVTTGTGTNTLPSTGTLPNVLDNPTFTFVFDHAVDYASLLHNGITLRDASNAVIPGLTLNFALSADQKTVTLTTSGLAAGTTYHMGVAYFFNLYDVAGNTAYNYATYFFTTQ